MGDDDPAVEKANAILSIIGALVVPAVAVGRLLFSLLRKKR